MAEGIVPEVWAKLMLKKIGASYADYLREFGIELPPLKPLTRRQKLRLKLNFRLDKIRERIALWIAPWLYRDPWE